MSRRQAAAAATAALKRLSRAEAGRSFNELRVVLALERAVARLENHTRLCKHLVFKGGFVLLKTVDTVRFTRDVDALAVDIVRAEVPRMVSQAIAVDLQDGVWFGDLIVRELLDQGAYGGFRFDCAFQLGDPPADVVKLAKLSRIHIDVGLGDAVKVPPDKRSMASVLPGNPPISWFVYPLEYIFAEKLEALFSRGSASSRAKDIYDMVLIFPKCDLARLRQAIIHTFAHRGTEVPISFAQTASAFDLAILRSSWKSVVLAEKSLSFEAAWSALGVSLRALDSNS